MGRRFICSVHLRVKLFEIVEFLSKLMLDSVIYCVALRLWIACFYLYLVDADVLI